MAVSLQIQTGYLTNTVLQCYHYNNLFSYTLYLLEKSWENYSVLNNKNYNKFIHINIHCVHKYQIQLLTLSVIKIFLSFTAYAVFRTLSSSGDSNVQKTLFIDVKSFHQCIKTKRKLSVLSIHSNQVQLATCNRNNRNII